MCAVPVGVTYARTQNAAVHYFYMLARAHMQPAAHGDHTAGHCPLVSFIFVHRVLSPVSRKNDKGAGAKNTVKCTCRRGSGPSAPARARFISLIGCTRVLCRAVSCSSGMPDDSFEARALCARRQCSRAAGSQQISRARSELSQRAALRPRPAWRSPPPSFVLLAVSLGC